MKNLQNALILLMATAYFSQLYASSVDSLPMIKRAIKIKDSINLSYFDVGQGPAIVFIHGLGSNKKSWSKTIAYLKDQYRCLALDLPGYGESYVGDCPRSMSFFSECIVDFVSALGIDNFHLAGHSMGGHIALYTAIHSPSSLESLILMAPAGIETFDAEDRKFLKNVFNAELIQSFDEQRIRLNFYANFYEMPADAEFMIEDRLRMKEDTAAYARYAQMIPLCVEGMLSDTVFQDLQKIHVPAMVVYGKQDNLIPNKYLHPDISTADIAERAKARIADAESHLIDKAGHFVHWEQAERVNSLVKAHLDKVNP